MSVKLRTGAGWMGWPPPLTQPPGQAMTSMKSYCFSPLRTMSSTLPALAVPSVETVTVAVLLLASVASARGQSHVRVFKRSISDRQVRDAMSITVIMLILCFTGAVVLVADSGLSFLNSLYETASALATVGLTANVTPLLHLPSKLIIIAFMYFGRVGILTISLGFLMGDRAVERFRYAETKLLIG